MVNGAPIFTGSSEPTQLEAIFKHLGMFVGIFIYISFVNICFEYVGYPPGLHLNDGTSESPAVTEYPEDFYKHIPPYPTEILGMLLYMCDYVYI